MSKSDGRAFGWQRIRGGARAAVAPVIVWDRLHGCSKVEFVGEMHLVDPAHYHLTLDELVEKFPAPEVQPDWKGP